MSQRFLPSNLEELVLSLCEDLATPFSLLVAIHIRAGAWDDIAKLQVVPEHYLNAHDYWKDAVIGNFLRKCEDLPTTVDRKAAAIENFWSAEKKCFRTNRRLESVFESGLVPPEDAPLLAFLIGVKKKIRRILGKVPTLLTEGRFGPGATFGDNARFATVPDKMSSRPTLTPGACYHLFDWVGTAWGKTCAAESRGPEFVRGNRFAAVPKDCMKHRGIAIEPSLNVFYQLALGQVMRKRLLRVGIDLQHGQAWHRQLAREASREGHLATIDLKNASDSVCTTLVRLLLPSDWYELLCSLRSPFTRLDGKWVLLEKFSSMGNGFTFELETLIFYALAWQVMSPDEHLYPPGRAELTVYGDDIIVPTAVARDVLAALKYFGFEANPDKTFIQGPFRESCGGDFFDGVDVRPFHLRSYPNEPQDFITIANGLRRLGTAHSSDCRRSRAVNRARDRAITALPLNVRRCRGPEGLGDIVIHDDNPTEWWYRWKHGIRYLRVVLPETPRRVSLKHFSADVVLAYALYQVGWSVREDIPATPLGTPSGDECGVSPRGSVRGYRVCWTPFS